MNIERVREIREMGGGMSLQEAKAIERQERLKRAIEEAKTVDDLRPILLDLLKHTDGIR